MTFGEQLLNSHKPNQLNNVIFVNNPHVSPGIMNSKQLIKLLNDEHLRSYPTLSAENQVELVVCRYSAIEENG